MRFEPFVSLAIVCAAICTCLLRVSASAEPTIIGDRDGKDIVTVRGIETTKSKQALPIFFPGISGQTAGATGLSLLKVVITSSHCQIGCQARFVRQPN